MEMETQFLWVDNLCTCLEFVTECCVPKETPCVRWSICNSISTASAGEQ